jgi:hypothetical protein
MVSWVFFWGGDDKWILSPVHAVRYSPHRTDCELTVSTHGEGVHAYV